MKLRSLDELDGGTEGTVQMRKSVFPVAGESNSSTLVLVPHPSQTDPNDPLRWPLWKKHFAFAAVCAFTFLTNYGIGGLSPAFYILSLQFHKTPTEAAELLLWPILVLGVFNFFWVPIANYFGKRPVFVFACLLLTVTSIWGAVAQSFESLLWSNIVGAFAGSSTEALGAAVVNDLYFLHERGNKMSIYLLAISGGNSLGPLICGFVVQTLGWRWHKWMTAIFTGVTWLAVLFFFSETRYNRDFSASLETVDTSTPHSGLSPIDEERIIVSASSEKKTLTTTVGLVPPNCPLHSSIELPKKSYMQQLSLWSGVTPNANLLELFIRPIPLIVYPAIIFAFLGYAVSLAWVVAVNILNSFVLQAPPYNWSPAVNGLINLPGFIGNFVGAITGGWCVDRYSDWQARRNGGVFKPETRLVLLIVPVLIVPAGCLVFGYGVQNTLHWTAIFFAYGMVSLGLTAVPSIGMTYVSDCLLPVAPDALILVNGLKNIVAFGFLYGVVPWITSAGYVNVFGTQAGIYVGIVGVGGALLWAGGERARRVTGKWRIIL